MLPSLAIPSLVATAKGLLASVKSARFHRRHHKEAASVLDTVESVRGKTDPGLIRKSNEYAREVLGWRGYAPWLRVYSAVAGTFHEGWIPDNYYGAVVVPAVQGKYGRVSGLRTLGTRLFGGSAFPDLLYQVNGLFFTPENEIVPPQEAVRFLFAERETVVFKIDGSAQGRNIRFIDKAAADQGLLESLGNGVFQTYVEQHPDLSEFMPGSVATLRMTTALDDLGAAQVRACYLMLGRSGDTHIRSVSRLRVPIDRQSGALDATGFLPSWLTVDRHPDTGVPFAGRVIPHFDACVSTVLDLHRSVPGVRCVGWDVAVDRNSRVRVMEWNGRFNDIKFSEATQGPCFADLGWERLWRV